MDGDAGANGDATGCVESRTEVLRAHLDGPCASGICQVDGTCALVPRIGDCDNGDSCTKDDACAGTTCAGTAYACDDGLTCTTNRCDGIGGCLTQQTAASCLVAEDGVRGRRPQSRRPVPGVRVRDDLVRGRHRDLRRRRHLHDRRHMPGGYLHRWATAFRRGDRLDRRPAGPLVFAGMFQGQVVSDSNGIVVNAQSVHALDPQGVIKWSTSSSLRILAVDPSGLVWLGGPCFERARRRWRTGRHPSGRRPGVRLLRDPWRPGLARDTTFRAALYPLPQTALWLGLDAQQSRPARGGRRRALDGRADALRHRQGARRHRRR